MFVLFLSINNGSRAVIPTPKDPRFSGEGVDVCFVIFYGGEVGILEGFIETERSRSNRHFETTTQLASLKFEDRRGRIQQQEKQLSGRK